MPLALRDDVDTLPLPMSEGKVVRAKRVTTSGEGKKGILKQVQDDTNNEITTSDIRPSRNDIKELNVLTSYRLNDFKKKAAFTLAEVLITLGIIGVVAAMTIPTLIAKYQERQTVSQLLKVYSTFASAYQMVQAEYGTIDTWGMTATDTGEVDEEGNKIYDHSAQKLFIERFKKYLKISKQCEVGKVCFPYASYSLDGTLRSEANRVQTGKGDSPVEGKFILQDGTYVSLGWFTNKTGCLYVILPQGKESVLGKNRFYFDFDSKGFFPRGMKDGHYSFEDFCNPEVNDITSGQGCTAWVIYNKNLDYLHCHDKLSWDGAHSCKEAE